MDGQQSTEEVVNRLRVKFLCDLETKEELYHEVDVKRVRTDNWQIERFVITQQNEDKAYEALVSALQWKKSFGVHERTDHYFPIEFYENFDSHLYESDKRGRLIHWYKTRNERNISNEINVLNNQFMAHILEKFDTEVHRTGFTMVTDTNGTGLTNINMTTQKFKIGIMKYYPELINANYVVDLPWLLKGVSMIILSWCDKLLRDRTHFINRNDLTNLIDPELIPLDLGGKREPGIVIPEGTLPFNELSAQLGLTDKQLEMYFNSYK